jgi:hypothetical protein
MDDYSRYVVHAELYDCFDQSIVEDCLRKAIVKEGAPKKIYFDNGGQYKNRWMKRLCAVLGIKLLYAKPYHPEGTGKPERFNRTVEGFFAEADLQKLTTLGEYNYYLGVWLQECYQTKVHSSLKETPLNAYQKSKNPLRFVDTETLAYAFLHSEDRKVDKSGCISLDGQLYDVGLSHMGRRVEVLYDPADKSTVTVKHGSSGFSKTVTTLKIGPKAAPRPKMPETLLPVKPGSSRLLDAKKDIFDKTIIEKRKAIRYSAFENDGTDKQNMGTNGGRSHV